MSKKIVKYNVKLLKSIRENLGLGAIRAYKLTIALKTISKSGVVSKDKILPLTLSLFPKKSTKTLYKWIQESVEIGFINKNRSGDYLLSSYDSISRMSGLNVINRTNQKGKIISTNQPIIKVELKQFLDSSYLAYEELCYNFFQQLKSICNKTNTKNCNKELKRNLNEIISHVHWRNKTDIIDSLHNSRLLLQPEIKDIVNSIEKGVSYNNQKRYCNEMQKGNAKQYFSKDVTISCIGMARLLGFNSTNKGQKILQEMKDKEMVGIKKRSLFIPILDKYNKKNNAFFKRSEYKYSHYLFNATSLVTPTLSH